MTYFTWEKLLQPIEWKLNHALPSIIYLRSND